MNESDLRYHIKNSNGAVVYSTDNFDAAVRWGFDYDLTEPWSVLTTRDGSPVIERTSTNLVYDEGAPVAGL